MAVDLGLKRFFSSEKSLSASVFFRIARRVGQSNIQD
jgi:hypothetical protein